MNPHPRMTSNQMQAVSELWDAASDLLESMNGDTNERLRDRLVAAISGMFSAFPVDHPVNKVSACAKKSLK